MLPNPLNAFCTHTHASSPGRSDGPLAGVSFAVKDVFDIAGHRTGNGHPVWFETHPPAERSASSVQKILDAGARLVGKTHTDEMAYSLNGENVHYGTPTNPRAPDRIPGGSSSGSAVAVASKAVDFAIGTDCGGSVRLPASYCGIYGIRTSHGLVPADGVVPLAASFDTVGWFARDAAMMQRVADVLLPPAADLRPRRLLVAEDAFSSVGAAMTDALASAVAAASAHLAETKTVSIYDGESARWPALFRILQGAEVGENHGAWIAQYHPTFGPGIRERFEWTKTIDPAEVVKAKPQREELARRMDDLLGDDALLCVPTAPGIAPKLNTPPAELEVFRARAFALLSIAGLARLPQVSVPVGLLDGCPAGLSFIAPRGRDRGLLDWIADAGFKTQ